MNKPIKGKNSANNPSPVDKGFISDDQQKKSDNHFSTKNSSEKSTLTYQESLDSLDAILDQLQKGEIPLEEIEACYERARFYLEHCEKLLSELEQKVLRISPEVLEANNDPN